VKPALSVVVPLYNGGRWVEVAVQSALAQGGPELEVIVVDDGSTDDGPERVRRIQDPRVRIVAQENRGVSAARNRGVRESRAGIVAFLDADDVWLPGFRAETALLRERFPDAAVWATGYLIESGGARRPARVPSLPADYRGLLGDYPALLHAGDPPFCTISATVRKDAFLEVGGFPESVRAGEDLVLFFKLGSCFPVAWSVLPGALYRAPAPVERGIRTTGDDDPLAAEVRRFREANPSIPERSADLFLAYWFRNRAATYLVHGRDRDARRWAWRSFRRSGRLRPLAYAALSLLPFGWGGRFVRGVRSRGEVRA
jgi:glycosyltransferase involved in cell wall biosynthesis